MHPLTTLRSWLGRPQPGRRAVLRCEGLEDRSTPAGLNGIAEPSKALPAVPSLAALPVSPSEVVAQTSSADPIGDLANIVVALGLQDAIDPAASDVLPLGIGRSMLSIALRPGASVPAVVQVLSASGLYPSVSPNYVYPVSRNTLGADLRERTPADPQFGQQFFHPIIRTPQAWDKTTGSASVTTAILDDGLDFNHPDLAPNVWTNPGEVAGNGIDDDNNGMIDDVSGWDFVNDTPNVLPDDPNLDTHGTQVAGLIAGRIDNAAGGAGVAGSSRVMPLKVIGSGPTDSVTLARAISYAVRSGAKIINCSLNVDAFVDDPTFRGALAFAYSSGVLWVNSEGNGNVQGPPREAFGEMILVGATDRNDVKTAYSNYGSGLDIVAPGGDPAGGLLTTVPGGGFARAVGTSMAAALFSGAAALVWSLNPSWTRDQVASTLLTNADDIRAKNPGLEDKFGAGRLDAEGAVNSPGVTRLGTLTGLPPEGAQVDSLADNGFSIRLTAPLDPNTIIPENFDLRSAGADGQFNTPDDVRFTLVLANAADYRVGTNSLDLVIGQTLTPGLYRFTARSGGLKDPFGGRVDGDGDGQAGGDLVRHFRIGYQVAGTVYEDTNNTGTPSDTDPGIGGQTVYADLNGNGVFDQSTFNSQSGTVPLADADPHGVTFAVPISSVSRPIGLLSISVLVSHPRPSDLIITLTAPDGTTVFLMRNRAVKGDPSQSLHLFLFADDANNTSDVTPSLTTHRLRPDTLLASLLGKNANGTWILTVSDTTLGDAGEVRSGALTVADEPATRTNELGGYALSGLPLDTVRVNVNTGAEYTRSGTRTAISVDLKGGQVATADLGLVRPSGIYGRVLADDGSRSFSPNDTPVGGATVFLDLNGNRVPDAGEPSTRTDANGTYVFGPLLPGTYTITVIPPGGFVGTAGVPTTRTVIVGDGSPVSTGNDFLLSRGGGRATATVTPITPAFRTTGVDAVGVGLSEPLPPLTLANFLLTRNGIALSLDGATVFGGPGGYTLSGLRELTSVDGEYVVTVFAPAPPGQVARQPLPASVTFTVDGTAPSAALAVEGTPIDAVRLTLSEPVTGFAASALMLSRDGVNVPLRDVRLEQLSPTEFRVTGLAPSTAARGLYRLTLRPNTVADQAGNVLTATTSTTFRVGPEPKPPVGRRTVIGAGAGGPATVAIFDTGTGRLVRSFQPFDPGFTGGVRVSAIDLTGDGIDDVVAAAGPGGGPRVMGFDGDTGEVLFDLMAFESSFTGGVYVATGDLDGSGTPRIVLTPDLGGGPRVMVMDTAGTTLASFFAIDDPNFRGGARATVGDVTGDGKGDLIVSAGFSGGPRVAVYDGPSVLSGALVKPYNDFFAFEPTLRNGAFVSAGDVDGDGFAELILGGGPGGGPRVKVLNGRAMMLAGEQQTIADFFAADPSDRGGVRVAVKDADGDGLADVVAGDGNGNGASARVYFGRDLLVNPEIPMIGQQLSAFGGFGDGIFVG